jgi:ligand-binding SRPBCC domain-containing protein
MKIFLKTTVEGNYKTVASRFDLQLFEYLVPPFTKVNIETFTGSKKGDKVHVKFLFPLKAEWISDITEDGADDKQVYFVDKGRVLPPGLKYWEHKHIILRHTDNTSIIVDDIEFKGLNPLLSILLYIPLWLTFRLRKPLYKKFFKK